MTPYLQSKLLALGAACAALLTAGCGGGSGVSSMSNASASNVRYSQEMTIVFNGQGLDNEVLSANVNGPCTKPTRLSGASGTAIAFRCSVTGVGRIIVTLVDGRDSQPFGSLAVDVPMPQVSLTVSDGTRSGTMLLELDPAAAPLSSSQFISYAKSGFYSGVATDADKPATVFHRVSPGSAILGGGYSAAAEGFISAKLPTQGDLVLERTGLKNLRGAVAMYREARLNSANSMFFINTVDNPQFDAGSSQTPDGYAVFGKVVQGLDVVDEIAKVPVRSDLSLRVNDVPVTAVRITAAVQTR